MNDIEFSLGDCIGDMHGRNVGSLLREGLDALYYRAPKTAGLEVREGIQLRSSCLKNFIEESTGVPYCNKDLVVIGEEGDGLVVAYSYDGTHGGILKMSHPDPDPPPPQKQALTDLINKHAAEQESLRQELDILRGGRIDGR